MKDNLKTLTRTIRMSPSLVRSLEKQQNKDKRKSFSDMVTVALEGYLHNEKGHNPSEDDLSDLA